MYPSGISQTSLQMEEVFTVKSINTHTHTHTHARTHAHTHTDTIKRWNSNGFA